MNQVYEALYDKVTGAANDFDTAIDSRYYSERAPQKIASPYCVVHLIVSTDDSTFTEQLDLVTVQFSIYSKPTDNFSAVEIGELYTKLRSLMDNAVLDVQGYTHYQMDWKSASPLWIPEEEVWQYIVEYQLEIEEARS